jgi:hypothetical protein
VRVIYDGRLHVSYWQAYVEPLDPGLEDDGPDAVDAFEGQINGLLGAGQPGRLWLSTAVSRPGSGNRPTPRSTHSHEGLTLLGTLSDR